MRVEHVGICALGAEQKLENLVRVIAVAEMRPQIHSPGRGPSGRLVASDLQRLARSGRELGRIAHVDLVAREYAEQVRDVAMVQIRRLEIPVLEPFLKLAGLADLAGCEP